MPFIVAAPVLKLHRDGVSLIPLAPFTKGVRKLDLNAFYGDAQILGNLAEEEDDAVLV